MEQQKGPGRHNREKTAGNKRTGPRRPAGQHLYHWSPRKREDSGFEKVLKDVAEHLPDVAKDINPQVPETA